MLNNVLGTLKYDITAVATSLVITPLTGTTFNLPPGGTDTTGATTGAVATYGKPVEVIILADRLDLSQAKYEIIQCTTRVPEAAGAYTHTIRTGGRGAENSTATAWTAANGVYVFQVTTAAMIDLLASSFSMRAQAMIQHRDLAILDWDGTTFKFGIFRVIGAGRGFHASTVGYMDIIMPANGSVAIGYGGASNITAAAGGWPLPGNASLYYEPDLNNSLASTSATNFRVVHYASDFIVPPHWIFLATYPGVDAGDRVVRVCNGATLSPWIAPTLLNSWVNYGAPYANASYQKSADGWVTFKGLIKSGVVTGGTTIFNLPAGYRPLENAIFVAPSNGGYAEFELNPAGNFTARIAANGFLSLENIRFKAAQ